MTLTVNASDFTNQPFSGRVVMTPLWKFNTGASGIIVADKLWRCFETGQATFSGVASGAYLLTFVPANYYGAQITPVTIQVGSGDANAKDLITSSIQLDANLTAYTKAQANALFYPLSNPSGFGRGSGSGGNVSGSFIPLSGGAAYNSSGVKMADFQSGILTNPIGLSVDWTHKLLMDDVYNIPTVDWAAKLLYRNITGSPDVAVDWEDSVLYGINGATVNWSSMLLTDETNQESVDWQNRLLSDIGGIAAVNWNSRTLQDTGNNILIDWHTHNKLGISGTVFVDYATSDLTNATGNNSLIVLNNSGINAQSSIAYLFPRVGSTPLVKLRADSNGILNVAANSQVSFWLGGDYPAGTQAMTIDTSYVTALIPLVTQFINDPTFTYEINLSNGVLTYNNLTVIDFGSQQLNDSSANSSVQWANRVLTDASSSASVDWANHLLYDGNANTLDWNNRNLLTEDGNWSTDGAFIITGYNALTLADSGLFYAATNPNHYVKSGTINPVPSLASVSLTGATGYINWSGSNSFQYLITSHCSLYFTGVSNGQTISVAVTQNTGNATVSWPTGFPTLPAGVSGVKWQGRVAPVLSTGSGITDIYTFTNINSIIYGSVMTGF